MKQLILTTLSTLFLVLFAISSQAQVTLVAWDFSSAAGDQTNDTADTFATNISTSGSSGLLIRGTGINPSARTNSFSATHFTDTDGAGSFADALSDGDYFEFSVNPNSGFTLDLDELNINFDISGSGPDEWGVFTNVDSYAAAVGTYSPSDTGSSHTIDLKDSSFNNLSGITIRFVGHAATSTAGTAAFIGTGDDLELTGNVIPEPSTYSLIFGGIALGVVVWKRRRKAAWPCPS